MAPFFLFLAFFLLSKPSPSASQRQQSMASFSSSDSPWLPMQNKILLSPNSTFAAGFYPVANSSKHFNFSIWYYKLPGNITTTVWTANKHDSPLSTNASLVITATRELRLTDSSSRSNLWPGAPNATNNSTRLVLNEDGNLVFDKWESFHFPTDTFLPNQSINGTELVSQNGKFRFLNSSVLSFNYPDNYWTSDKVFGQLNSDGSVNQGNDVSIISADHGVARMRRLTLDNDGNLRALQRSSTSGDACERKRKLTSNTKFLQLDYVNFTGGSNQTNLKLDRLLYGYWSPGTEVAMFLRVDSSETAETNFTGMSRVLDTTCPVRVTLPFPPRESNTTTRNIAIICTLFAAELIAGILFFWAFLKKYIKYRDMAQTLGLEFLPAGGPKRFTYAELKAATDDFSDAIGKGGFGDVYRGELPDKRVVAVKCLKNVTGGDAEFWAEVTIIARMHHLNLVRLWGFCAEKGQRILVYEYVPNGSLDRYLFPAGRVASSGTEAEMGPAQDSSVDSEEWYFPRWAFDKVFKEMRVEDILDRQIKHCYDDRVHFDMVDRMVKTALWCLQDRADMRPSMGKVAKMLEGIRGNH
ncbi:hypothetical protein OIU77_014395 [Salix suchowensis]|uniref:Non-specific serine/threonine protein kinase n=1 Tax=Salix suchowensis TaxID=1278906 RepID=A0ABQ8ZX38_9ROSI|nr:hypothetical protein OIU77_014395 [Salix suchowensis]